MELKCGLIMVFIREIVTHPPTTNSEMLFKRELCIT